MKPRIPFRKRWGTLSDHITEVELLFEKRDAWIGIFWDAQKLNGKVVTYDIYVCLIPFFPIHLKRYP